ncbi:MAG: hypothetical protein R3D66_06890 [Alphaproteobacteria bacterium]
MAARLQAFSRHWSNKRPYARRNTSCLYGAALEQLAGQVTIRPSYGMHPRLMILGQLEARLIEAGSCHFRWAERGNMAAGNGS